MPRPGQLKPDTDGRDGYRQLLSAIPHEKLMQAVEERVSDQGVLKLLRAMLHAGVMHEGTVRREVSGTPQGGPGVAVALQCVPAPVGPGMEYGRARCAGALLR